LGRNLWRLLRTVGKQTISGTTQTDFERI
jgi:hypothetical protein